MRHAVALSALGQELHQVTDGEIGRVALPAVAELLAVAKGVVVRHVDDLDLVADSHQRALDQVVVRGGQPRHQQRRGLALRLGELRVHHRVVPVLDVDLLGGGDAGRLGLQGRQLGVEVGQAGFRGKGSVLELHLGGNQRQSERLALVGTHVSSPAVIRTQAKRSPHRPVFEPDRRFV